MTMENKTVLKVDASIKTRSVILSIGETEIAIPVEHVDELIKNLSMSAQKINSLDSLFKGLRK